jgi:hypothetical protein
MKVKIDMEDVELDFTLDWVKKNINDFITNGYTTCLYTWTKESETCIECYIKKNKKDLIIKVKR